MQTLVDCFLWRPKCHRLHIFDTDVSKLRGYIFFVRHYIGYCDGKSVKLKVLILALWSEVALAGGHQ